MMYTRNLLRVEQAAPRLYRVVKSGYTGEHQIRIIDTRSAAGDPSQGSRR